MMLPPWFIFAAANPDTRRTAAGKFDPKHRSFLSYRTLFDALLADLIDDPL